MPSTLGIWATYQEPHLQNKLTYFSLPGAINLQQLLRLGRVWCQAWVQYKFAIWPLRCIYLLVWQMVMKKEIRWKVLLILTMCRYIHTVHVCEHIQIIHFVSPTSMALVLLALFPWHQTQVLENNIENRWLITLKIDGCVGKIKKKIKTWRMRRRLYMSELKGNFTVFYYHLSNLKHCWD